MASQGWMLLLVLGTGAVVWVPAARLPPNQESLRSALDAVVRKQRSLDPVDYNELHSFKYHGGDADRKFDRDLDEEEEEEIEFLPGDNGQLEMVGDNLQGLNNKLLERALLDYLESLPEQEEPVPSIFRERERSTSRKRGSYQSNVDIKELAKLLEQLRYDNNLLEDDDDILRMFYDRYKAGRGNNVYETAGPMSLGELSGKGQLLRGQARNSDDNEEYNADDQDQSVLFLSPIATERRNVNGRFPIGREFGAYHRPIKRYPVAKRSPRPAQTKLKTTDPKVAQDLGALFGTQSTDVHNRTHKPDYDPAHDHIHDNDHERVHVGHENSSEAPAKVTPSPKSTKENVTKAAKSKFVQVRKKSIDWSQYFGIDRRRKKAAFTAGPGTQNQDDEWMLQRYYENMAENLKPKEAENKEKDKLELMDSKLKYLIKDLIIGEALQYANMEDEQDIEKVKDKLMTRMAAAYSLQKMRKALNDLRNNVAAQKEAQNNLTSNYRDNGNHNGNGGGRTDEKRNSISNIDTVEEDKNCPDLKSIERICRTVIDEARDQPDQDTRMFYIPCVKLLLCKTCSQNSEEKGFCLTKYVYETSATCYALEPRAEGLQQVVGDDASSRLVPSMRGRHEEKQSSLRSCVLAMIQLTHLLPSFRLAGQCHAREELCLRRYHY